MNGDHLFKFTKMALNHKRQNLDLLQAGLKSSVLSVTKFLPGACHRKHPRSTEKPRKVQRFMRK